MKFFFKILTIIFSLLIIIPGDKLSFPVGLLVLLEFTDGALGVLFGLSFLATILYLLISAILKYDDKLDDLTTMAIILFYYILLSTQTMAIFNHGYIEVFVSVLLFISVSLTTFLIMFSKLRGRVSKKVDKHI